MAANTASTKISGFSRRGVKKLAEFWFAHILDLHENNTAARQHCKVLPAACTLAEWPNRARAVLWVCVVDAYM